MEAIANAGLTWLGIVFCLSQSAIFSGLNLAFFSISRLRLEIEVANGNTSAEKVLSLRNDSNMLLATVLWGNVSINVLLTLLSNSVMFGVTAFLFSTFAITIGGEILPQAYFSRNAMRMAATLSPVLSFYRILLYALTKPTAILLDIWLGKEGVQYFRERDLRQLIHKHMDAAGSDLDAVEGIGALNFLAIDDVPVSEEGETVAKQSIIQTGIASGLDGAIEDESLTAALSQIKEQLIATSYRWLILVDQSGYPVWVLDADSFVRALHADCNAHSSLLDNCHRPTVVTDPKTRLGSLLAHFKEHTTAQSDAPLAPKVILMWSDEKRIITSADILGRLLKGIGLYNNLNKPAIS